MKLAILITLIQLINAFPKWDTPSTPRWRRDAEAERHRVAGNCKFYMMKGDLISLIFYLRFSQYITV